MSNKREREKRREQRLAEESKAGSKDRRTRLLQLGAGAAFLAVVIVAVLIVLSGGSDDGGDTKLEGVDVVNEELAGIPEKGLVLGDPKAPVEVIEWGDLQCPACKAYSEEILPQVIEGQVAQGQAKIAFRNFTIIGPQSTPAGAAALAAGEQGRGWHFIDIFYKNQGVENSEYADDEFLTTIAKNAGVEDIAKWNKERETLTAEVERTSEEAQQLGLSSTPSFAIKGPSTNGMELITISSPEELESAIDAAS